MRIGTEKPSVTPITAFAIKVRIVPHIARCLRSVWSETLTFACNFSVPSSTNSMARYGGTRTVSVPRSPTTSTQPGVCLILTARLYFSTCRPIFDCKARVACIKLFLCIYGKSLRSKVWLHSEYKLIYIPTCSVLRQPP